MPKQIRGDYDFLNASRILNLPDAQLPQQPATFAQLSAAIEGVSWKTTVRVTVLTNINLSSPGSTLDGVAMAIGNRFIANGQTNQPDNGIYIWNGATTPATRALDANTGAELESATAQTKEGTSAGVAYRQTQVNIILGTSNVLFTSFGQATPPATSTQSGTVQIATAAEVNAGTDIAKVVTPATLAQYTGKARVYTGLIGDGSQTSFTITHGFGTRDVSISVYDNSGNYADSDCDKYRPTVNTVNLVFTSAPAVSSVKVVIIG